LSDDIEKIQNLINEKKIKKIIFIPSKKEIWEIKSNKNNNIYLIDVKENFCSCKGFYYNFTKKICYHIQAVSIAYRRNRYEIEFLKDTELNNYLNNLLDNLMNNNK
jgi:predicted nucleic acid-binding Zn finger protein